MTDPAVSPDYGVTVNPATYISGLMVHPWIPQMYELMVQRTVKEIKRRLKDLHRRQLKIYDLGCGPGHFTLMLAQRIYQELGGVYAEAVEISGFDNSESFIDFADMRREKNAAVIGSSLSFHRVDVLELKIFPADIVVTSGFFHHFAPEERGAVYAKVASLLRKGGVLIDGDEHLAQYEWFERQFPGEGRCLSLCMLYFQVILAAFNAGHQELQEVETENFLAEVYRNDPNGMPRVTKNELHALVRKFAADTMHSLIHFGLAKACETALGLFTWVGIRSTDPEVEQVVLTDRGDHKDPVPVFIAELETHRLGLIGGVETGNPLLGSAPVLVFQKQ